MKKGKAGLGITLTALLLAIMIAVGCVVNTYSEQISYWWSGTRLGGVHEDIPIDVLVTNTGSAAGKDVVAFGKTKLLQPGEGETLTLSLNADDLASYDAKGLGCYLAETGDYMLYVSVDAHKVKCDPIVYHVDSDRVYNDGGVGTEDKPYLSRKDFTGTNPNNFLETYVRKMLISMGPEMVNYMQTSLGGSDVDLNAGDSYKDPNFSFAEGQDKGIKITEMAGVPYDDAKWTEFVSQLSFKEMIGTLKEGFTGTLAIDGYSKEMTGGYMLIDNQIFAGAGTLLFIGDWAVENTGVRDGWFRLEIIIPKD